MSKYQKICVKLCVTLSLLTLQMTGRPKVCPQTGQSSWQVARNIGTTLDEINRYKPTEISNDYNKEKMIHISEPGIYRLSETLNKKIMIKANQVKIDLNGYGIQVHEGGNGITLSSNIHRVVIENGFIESIQDSPTDYGIYISANAAENISEIYLNNIKVIGFENGIHIEAKKGEIIILDNPNLLCELNIFNIRVLKANSITIPDGSISNCHITNCKCTKKGQHGFYINGPSNSLEYLSFVNCSAQNKNEHGFYINNIIASEFNHCTSSKNKASGFSIGNVSSIIFETCKALENKNGFHLCETKNSFFKHCFCSMANANTENSYGFFLNNASNNFFRKCDATNNKSTFGSAYGFNGSNSTNNVFEKCTASNNKTNGFYFNSSNNNLFEECTAINNGTTLSDNYSFGITTNNDRIHCKSKFYGLGFTWEDNTSNEA